MLCDNGGGTELVSVMFKNESFWLLQKAMGDWFGCASDNISLRLKNILAEEELDKASAAEKISVTATDGRRCYNLDAIIAVGYRVRSEKVPIMDNVGTVGAVLHWNAGFGEAAELGRYIVAESPHERTFIRTRSDPFGLHWDNHIV